MDADTSDPFRLGDAELIDAVVGFEHLAAWAGARQARVLAEFAPAPPFWIGVGTPPITAARMAG